MASRPVRRRPDQPRGEWLYGRNAVRESLRAGRRQLRRLLLAGGASLGNVLAEIQELARNRSVPVQEADRTELDRLTQNANHQGVCLLAGDYPYENPRDLMGQPGDPFFLVLDSLQDPQNVGSLLRTAEAVGVGGVLIPEHRAVAITPAVVNASAGAVEYLRIAQVTNLARSLDELKKGGVWVVGLEAVPSAVGLWEARLDGPLALVVGSEGEGIRRLVLEKCDVVAKLPLLGEISSLNAAVAGSVALYEVLRHRA